MAVSGTLTQVFTGYRSLKVIATGITQASNSPAFSLHGYPFSSAVVTGTAGAAATFQWQGSNDGGVNWVSVGNSFSSLPASGTISPSEEPYELYQLLVTGGDGTTNVAIAVYATSAK